MVSYSLCVAYHKERLSETTAPMGVHKFGNVLIKKNMCPHRDSNLCPLSHML